MEPLPYIALVLAIGILAQWFAWRFHFPSILLLLAGGMGLSAATGVQLDDFMPESTILAIVGFFVSIILFEGGLTLKFKELKESGAPVFRLCTIAVVTSFVLTAAALYFLPGLQYDLRIAALLGAILVVTGPTVVSPLLRLIKPSRKIASIVKWEGIVVDPIGAILAVLVFQAALAGDFEAAKTSVLIALGKTILVGVVVAFILGKTIELMMKRHLIPDFLEGFFILAVVGIAFAGSNMIQAESGLLTVTVLGMVLANQKSVSVQRILEFKENLRVLIISLLFVLLSGRLPFNEIVSALPKGLFLLFVLIFVIRPISVFGANLFSKKTSQKERLFLASLAPRGIVAAAVTSIFALEIEHAAHDHKIPEHLVAQAHELVPIVFIIIIGTVAFYGLLAAPLARKLGLATKNPTGVLFAGCDTWTRLIAKALHQDGHAVMLLDTQYSKIATARMEGLNAVRANILSEYAEEELEYSGIGQLVAATPNDEVNSLATREFSHIFGSSNVWQLTPQDLGEHHTKVVSSKNRARVCFTNSPGFSQLETLALQGAQVKSTTITEHFTLPDFYKTYGEGAFIIFLFSEEKGLRPAASDLDKVSEGTTIYAFIPQQD